MYLIGSGTPFTRRYGFYTSNVGCGRRLPDVQRYFHLYVYLFYVADVALNDCRLFNFER